jgi:hypothetical protein
MLALYFFMLKLNQDVQYLFVLFMFQILVVVLMLKILYVIELHPIS